MGSRQQDGAWVQHSVGQPSVGQAVEQPDVGHPGVGQRSKASVRAAVRSRRRARTPEERAADAEAVARTVMAHVEGSGVGGPVAAYVSTPTEPGTGPLRRALAGAGITVLLPVVGAVTGRPLTWVVDRVDGNGVDGNEVDGNGADGNGAEEAGCLADAGLVLLPALAVTGSGHRLGQGGGHYDRTLAALLGPRTPSDPSDPSHPYDPSDPSDPSHPSHSSHPSDPCTAVGPPRRRPLLVALVHDDELLADGAWPVEDHDAGVDAVATPSRWRALAQGDPAVGSLRATTPLRAPHP